MPTEIYYPPGEATGEFGQLLDEVIRRMQEKYDTGVIDVPPVVYDVKRTVEEAQANEAKGVGVKNSYHTAGLAADIWPSTFVDSGNWFDELKATAEAVGLYPIVCDRPHVAYLPENSHYKSLLFDENRELKPDWQSNYQDIRQQAVATAEPAVTNQTLAQYIENSTVTVEPEATEEFSEPAIIPEGIALIKSYEAEGGYEPFPYDDGPRDSIGWGTEAETGDYLEGISREEADRRFDIYMEGLHEELGYQLTRTPTSEQYAGLASFYYNVGYTQAQDAIGLFNQGDLEGVVHNMSLYNKDDKGIVLQGLVDRRQDEGEFIMGGTPERASLWAQSDQMMGDMPAWPGTSLTHEEQVKPITQAGDNRFQESQTGFNPISFPSGRRLSERQEKYQQGIQSGLMTAGKIQATGKWRI